MARQHSRDQLKPRPFNSRPTRHFGRLRHVGLRSFGAWGIVAAGFLAAHSVHATSAPIKLPDNLQHDALHRRTIIVDVADAMSAAVVNVHADEVVSTRMRSGEDINSLFKDFMEPRFRQEYATTSLGSGVLIDPQHVVTNFHVVKNGQRIRVTTKNGLEYGCEVLGGDEGLDLAVLRVRSKDPLPYIALGESTEVMVGETVIAIGNPFGLGHTVTTGVVSALHRTIQTPAQIYHDFVQIDASINPGNSGGPLINTEGQLIGINTAIHGRAQGIGFAIPVNRVKRIASEIIEQGKVRQGYVGFNIKKRPQETKDSETAQRVGGVVVHSIDPNSPAEKSGLQVGDVILKVERYPIVTVHDYGLKMRDYAPGDHIDMLVLSNAMEKQISVHAEPIPSGFGKRILEDQCGIFLAELNDELSSELGIDKRDGVVVTKIRANSLGDQAKMSQGDIVLQVGPQKIANISELDQIMVSARREGRIIFSIGRNNRTVQAGFRLH